MMNLHRDWLFSYLYLIPRVPIVSPCSLRSRPLASAFSETRMVMNAPRALMMMVLKVKAITMVTAVASS